MKEESLSAELATTGYAVIANVLIPDEMRSVARNLAESALQGVGSRRLLETRWCQALARRLAGEPRLSVVMPVAGRAVQCTLFEKRLDQNWLVALHQDLSIPVAERIDNDRCTGWSVKEGA
ncbi:MAG TPA: hypothetical protein VGE93_03820, partial [Bryobacteraceae bacterium]